MSFVRALTAAHYELYQTALALIAAVGLLHILLEYSWVRSCTYGTVTIAAYWAGQGIVALIQRALRGRDARSVD